MPVEEQALASTGAFGNAHHNLCHFTFARRAWHKLGFAELMATSWASSCTTSVVWVVSATGLSFQAGQGVVEVAVQVLLRGFNIAGNYGFNDSGVLLNRDQPQHGAAEVGQLEAVVLHP